MPLACHVRVEPGVRFWLVESQRLSISAGQLKSRSGFVGLSRLITILCKSQL